MVFKLFTTFFNIGLITFGGGYGMISIVKDICIDKNKWISDEDFINLIAIAESTPGPIAVNMATYIGYKQDKMKGAIAATIGVILPSMIIIYVISLFLNQFLSYKIVAYAFYGIRIAVSIIIIKVAYKLLMSELKSTKDRFLTLILFFGYIFIMLYTSYNSIKIYSIYIILSSIIIGSILCILRKDSIRGIDG